MAGTLVIAEVPGQTQEGYDHMIAALSPALKQAKGFIAQILYWLRDGWPIF